MAEPTGQDEPVAVDAGDAERASSLDDTAAFQRFYIGDTTSPARGRRGLLARLFGAARKRG